MAEREIVPHGRPVYPGSYSRRGPPLVQPVVGDPLSHQRQESDSMAPQQPAREEPGRHHEMHPSDATAAVGAAPPDGAGPPSEQEDQVGGDARPVIEHIDLPAVVRHRDVLVPNPEYVENVIEIPHVQYLERIEEVPKPRKVLKPIPVPKVDVTERVIEIPKHVKEQKIVEVPQVQVVDQVVEVPQYITQQKLIERPKVMLQERIIPIPKRIIEEKIVEVPKEDFEQILRERVEYATPAYGPAHPLGLRQMDEAGFVDEPLFGPDGKPLLDEHGHQLYRQAGEPLRDRDAEEASGYVSVREGQPGPTGRPVDEVVEIPHVQHLYRNIMQPVYRHVPKPVEIPLTHYKPIPVERIVDRNVPIPVELEVVQEFMCPRFETKYTEVPVPIPVTRVIEKPVAADAMFNSLILDAYMKGTPPVAQSCYQMCSPPIAAVPKAKMTPAEMTAAGINVDGAFNAKSFASRGTYAGYNVSHSRDFFTEKRSLVKEGEKA